MYGWAEQARLKKQRCYNPVRGTGVRVMFLSDIVAVDATVIVVEEGKVDLRQ